MNQLKDLLDIGLEDRDSAWELELFKAFPSAQVRVLQAEPRQGPDHWPYLLVASEDAQDASGEQDSVLNVIRWLSERGIGLVLNPHKAMPDFVFSYGMLWNFRERGEFLTPSPEKASGRWDIKPGQELFAGPPSEKFLPPYVRSLLKQFFADQGVFVPKALMVSQDNENFDLCFSLESLKSPPQAEHAQLAEAIAWFLPAHYSIALVSEKTIPGFQPI